MFNYLFYALIGCFLGIITGLTPGIHVNTVAIMGLSIFPRLSISPIEFAVIMVGMAVTHTFLDFIPSIFLGVPEEETALSVLPTHQLLIQGRAIEAVKLTAYGSLFGLFFALIFLLPALFLIPVIYKNLHPFILYILIICIIILILREREFRKIFYASIVFLLSGILGIFMFKQRILSTTEVLFPVFVGIFGLSNILFSLKSKSTEIVPQEDFITIRMDRDLLSSTFIGSIGGLIVGILPAMSPSQVGVIMYEIMGTNIRNFILSVSAINTSDAIYSFISLYTINNPRSGVATIIGKIMSINLNTLLLLVGVTSFIAFIATFLHIKIGRIAMRFVKRINYRFLSFLSLMFVLVLVLYFTGLFGLYMAILSTVVGTIPILSGISRTHCMGVLIVPTILYFLGC
ncbi:MAG: hypothetical protein DRO92_01280 [Candidatus Altiarchaeales archaeon]|nr:MAG: hypothetical protein DRO92_01280 [Candidatus Altiarchaeales archaeon]